MRREKYDLIAVAKCCFLKRLNTRSFCNLSIPTFAFYICAHGTFYHINIRRAVIKKKIATILFFTPWMHTILFWTRLTIQIESRDKL